MQTLFDNDHMSLRTVISKNKSLIDTIEIMHYNFTK